MWNRSGITITAGYALKQSSRLLKVNCRQLEPFLSATDRTRRMSKEMPKKSCRRCRSDLIVKLGFVHSLRALASLRSPCH